MDLRRDKNTKQIMEKLIRELSLEGAKTLGTLGVKPTNEQLANEVPLDTRQCTPFRAIAARGNYLGHDRTDI